MKRKTTIACGSVLIGMLVAGLFASIAWFDPGLNTFSASITGSVVEEYFHCGSGTQNDPFVITRPIHYYHMTEFFQRETVLPTSNGNAIFGSDYLYFQVGYDLNSDGQLEVYDYDNTGSYVGTQSTPAYSKTLNMSYYSGENALMPIGTSELPFFGSFNGGANTNAAIGITIDNLNIKCTNTVVVDNNTVTRKTADVGIFGYVADQLDSTHKTVISDAYFNNVTIDLTGVDGTIMSSGLTVEHTSVHTDTTYVGYIVGHLHSYTSYRVNSGDNSSPLHDVYVNNATISGGAGAKCNFGYVGYADTIDGQSGSEITMGDIIGEIESEYADSTADWGGSINTKEYMEWIYRSFTSPAVNNTMEESHINHPLSQRNTLTQTGEYSLEFSVRNANDINGETSFTELITKKNITYYNSFANPTCFNEPDTTRTALYNTNSKIKSVVYHLKDGNYLPLKFNDDKSETALGNSGYIVGNGTIGSSVEGNPQLTARYFTALGNSLDNGRNWTTGNSWNQTSIASFSGYENKVEVMTYAFKNENNSTNTGWRRISDSYNANNSSVSSQISSYTKTGYGALGLQAYEDSRANLQDIFSSSKRIQGILFKNSTLSVNNKITVNAKILGEEKTNYELPKGSLVCNLKSTGFINFFAGSFYGGSSNITNFRAFSLYKIERNPNNSISSLNRITKIYKNKAFNDDETKPRYFYQYDDNSFSIKEGSTHFSTSDADTTVGTNGVIFDSSISLDAQAPSPSVLYYFEVPVVEGEYALGLSTQSCDSGMALIYLDVGSNGSGLEPTYNLENTISDDPIFTQMEYTSNGYVINSCFNVAFVIPSGSTKEKFSITISRNGNVFSVVVINTSGNDFEIAILLVDNDDDPDNDYPYTYTLKYNSGAVSEAYGASGIYTGVSGGNTLSPPGS